jgi:FAD/FMN-containing dehydrogenase
MGFTRPDSSGASQMPLSRHGAGKPSCAFSRAAWARFRAIRSAFFALVLAAKAGKIIMNCLWILISFFLNAF